MLPMYEVNDPFTDLFKILWIFKADLSSKKCWIVKRNIIYRQNVFNKYFLSQCISINIKMAIFNTF